MALGACCFMCSRQALHKNLRKRKGNMVRNNAEPINIIEIDSITVKETKKIVPSMSNTDSVIKMEGASN